MITTMSQADKEMAELFRAVWEASVVGGWQIVGEWDAYNHAVNAGSNFAGLNLRIVLDKSMFSPTSKFRLSFDGVVDTVPGTPGTGIAVSVGLAALGGNPWDFASAPTQVLFAGQPTLDTVGVVIGEDANRYVSDEINLALDGTADVVVSMTMESGLCGSSMGTVGVPPDTWHMYLNLSPAGTIDELAPADLIDVRPAVGDNQQWNLSKVEILGASSPGRKCDWPNMKTPDHAETDTWARWALDYVGGRQETLQTTGNRKFSKQGLVYITVYTPLGGGLEQARDASEVAIKAYEGKRTPNDVWFRNVRIESEGHGQGTGRNKSWWTTLVVAEFTYEHLR